MAALSRRCFEAAVLAASVIFVTAVKLIGLIVPIKIGCLPYERGHLLANTEYWFRTNYRWPKGIYVFVSGKKPFNKHVIDMIKRKAPVIESDFMAKIMRSFQWRTKDSSVWIPLSESGHTRWKEWNGAPPQIIPSADDSRRGRAILERMGVPPGHSFVCFSARDDRYLEELHPVKDWGYHRYRNSDIRNYLSAMEELAAGGYWVFRMGALVNRPISSAHHRVIDYASLHRSDFMDVFLLSHCRFFVGDTAGIIAFPLTFNTPYVKVNCVPLNSLARNANAIFIPKTYREKSTGKTLTFSEIFRLGADMWYLSEQYERAGVEAVENTAEEIMEAVTEMRLRLDGKWRATEEDEMLQRKFRSLIPDDNELKGFVSRIGAAFISKNRHLME